MQQLLGMWSDYEANTSEVQGSKELGFISDLEKLELEPGTTASDLEDVLGVRRIVTDVVRLYNEFNKMYHATTLGLLAYYGNDKGYRSKVPNGDQLLFLKQFEPKHGQQDRGFVVYSGSQPLGPKTMF